MPNQEFWLNILSFATAGPYCVVVVPWKPKSWVWGIEGRDFVF